MLVDKPDEIEFLQLLHVGGAKLPALFVVFAMFVLVLATKTKER